MNTKKIIFISLLCVLVSACNKESDDPAAPTTNTTAPQSKKSLLCNEWTLKETFVDNVQKTSDGTGRYKLTTNGTFHYYEKDRWEQIGNYQWRDTDSNSLDMTLTYNGQSFGYIWAIKKLDEKNYNIEFTVGNQKLNYNYVR